MTSEFRDARGEVGEHVRVFIQRAVDPIEVLSIIGEVDADERRLRMTRDDAIESSEQLLAARVFCRVAEPRGPMILELCPPNTASARAATIRNFRMCSSVPAISTLRKLACALRDDVSEHRSAEERAGPPSDP